MGHLDQADYQTPQRMALKLKAIPLPELRRKRVLDIGTDFGAFAVLAHEQGATVTAIDRGRAVRGQKTDIIARNRAMYRKMDIDWQQYEAGKEWRSLGVFDVIFCFSVFHHIYEAAGGDLEAVWFWLWRHTHEDSIVLWENPTGPEDPVVRMNVSDDIVENYSRKRLMASADRYFRVDVVGPALHEPTREVWRLTPRKIDTSAMIGRVVDGGGGAATAFQYQAGRRCTEVEKALGVRPFPGSLNVQVPQPFNWGRGYYRVRLMDVAVRSAGFDSEWAPRWARFYPLEVVGVGQAFAMRFEGENYPQNFLELIAPIRLRDMLRSNRVTISR